MLSKQLLSTLLVMWAPGRGGGGSVVGWDGETGSKQQVRLSWMQDKALESHIGNGPCYKCESSF